MSTFKLSTLSQVLCFMDSKVLKAYRGGSCAFCTGQASSYYIAPFLGCELVNVRPQSERK